MYSEPIIEVLKQQGKVKPTLIQERTYDAIRQGESVVGLAKTGSGKTLAYSLPVLERLHHGQTSAAVIFEPTTELAVQTRHVLQPYAAALDLKMLSLVGAGNRQRQLQQLKKRKPEVLIATPGRFFDFFSANKIKPDQIQSLIIDEADDVLELFKTDLIASLGQQLSDDSQILLFGASESDVTKKCEQLFDRQFLKIDVRSEQVSHVEHGFLQVSNQYKIEFLQRLVKQDDFKGLLFFDREENLEHYAAILRHTKMNFDVLSKKQSKQAQEHALKKLAHGQTRLLLVTDLAARGLDIPGLTYVVNFEIPETRNVYLHRAGRTGRMNAFGRVITLGDDHDFRDLRKMLMPDEVTRVYFTKTSLSTHLIVTPKVKKTSSVSQSKSVPSPVKHKKDRWRQKKNKGYHPRGKEKREI